jgi:MoaA/NifB/PqqE/SkfB family radical SAM enzyme
MGGIPILRGFEFSPGEKELALAENRPLMLSLDLNSGCNLRCTYCFTNAGKRSPNQMSLLEYRRVIDQASAMGVKTVVFAEEGETLMDKKLFPLIHYSNEKGLYVVMFTNLTLISEKLAQELKKADVSVVGSLKSFSEKVEDKLAGVKGAGKRIHRGMQILGDGGFNAERPSRLGVDFLVCGYTKDEIPELVGWAVENNIYPMVERLLWKGRAVEHIPELEITRNEARKLNGKLVRRVPELAKERSYFSAPDCDISQYTIFVKMDGRVTHCFSIDRVEGNTMERPLKEIWDSPGMRALRSGKKKCGFECPGRSWNKGLFLKSLSENDPNYKDILRLAGTGAVRSSEKRKLAR